MTDIWSLGVLYFRMIYKCHPFRADSRSRTIFNILYEDANFPEEAELKDKVLISQILEKIPEHRITIENILKRLF